jgi:hypothetical protein
MWSSTVPALTVAARVTGRPRRPAPGRLVAAGPVDWVTSVQTTRNGRMVTFIEMHGVADPGKYNERSEGDQIGMSYIPLRTADHPVGAGPTPHRTGHLFTSIPTNSGSRVVDDRDASDFRTQRRS